MSNNNITGGVIGALIGALCAGPLGAIFGWWLGRSFLHLSNTERYLEDAADVGGEQLTEKAVLLFFQCLGKLAKSDGRVSEDEAEFVRSLMSSWGVDAKTRRRLGEEFNKGRDSTEPFLTLVRALNWELSAGRISRSTRHNIMQVFCSLVMADHELHPEERRMLEEAGRALDAEEYVRAFFADFDDSNSHSGNRRATREPERDELARSYELLGISPSASDAEVKSAYRKKAKEFHPDMVEGAGLSAAYIQKAKEMFQELGNAYDIIRSHRGMR